jgi:voltage-gated potassium channel Kch
VILHSQFFSTANCPRVYDTARDQDEPAVIIAGFGRFGQITARILAANGIPFTALDNNAEHIEFVKKFGNKVFYGDASRLDLLRTAGIAHARVLLIALDDEEQALRVAELVHEHYPDVRVVARAHNRFSVRLYRQRGAGAVVRELMGSSLEAAGHVLREYGFGEVTAANMVEIFRRHDEETLQKSFELRDDIEALIDHTNYGRQELASLFQQDRAELGDPN